MKKITEALHNLVESKQTEIQAINILKQLDIPNIEEVLSQFINGDTSRNQKNLPLMATFYVKGEKDIDTIVDVFKIYNSLEINNRIPFIYYRGGKMYMGETPIEDFSNFEDMVRGIYTRYQTPSTKNDNYTPEYKPLWSGSNIDIYKANSFEDCIEYTSGGLTGHAYKFCIGKPNNPAYQSYRNRGNSTFYFIVDRNRFKTNNDGTVDLSDPLHMVVLDKSDKGIKLTDTNNSTGRVTGYNTDEYLQYLKSKSVPLSIFVNTPKSGEEYSEQLSIGNRNTDLNWFRLLSNDLKFKYISRGHLLTDEQFDFLINTSFKDMLYTYVTTGVKIPENQLVKLSLNLKKSYIKKRLIMLPQTDEALTEYEQSLLSPDEKVKYYHIINQ